MDVYTKKELSRAWSRPTLLFMLALMFVIDFPVVDIPRDFLVKDAEAVIGRPGTPGSVGGVRRRSSPTDCRSYIWHPSERLTGGVFQNGSRRCGIP